MTETSGIHKPFFSTARAESPRSLEDFRGDFGNIAALMEESWAENKSQSLLYTEGFLRSCFEYPGSRSSLAPTIYHGAKPAAFVAGFPRTIRFEDKDATVLVITFLTVANEYKKSGYGIVVWSELIKRARSYGFDGMMNYCLEGEAMNGMILGCCGRLDLPTKEIFRVQYLMALLSQKTSDAEDISRIVETFMPLANSITKQTPLARIWNRKEAEWQCSRDGAVIARHRAGTRQGMLTGYILPIANPGRTQCLLIEDILWGDLEEDERQALVSKFIAKAAAKGARLASLPVLGYADIQPFQAARFRPSPRVLHAYLSLWTRSLSPREPLSSFYLDVF